MLTGKGTENSGNQDVKGGKTNVANGSQNCRKTFSDETISLLVKHLTNEVTFFLPIWQTKHFFTGQTHGTSQGQSVHHPDIF